LLRRIREKDVHWWSTTFLKDLEDTPRSEEK
jgi:hypothetical protein